MSKGIIRIILMIPFDHLIVDRFQVNISILLIIFG